MDKSYSELKQGIGSGEHMRLSRFYRQFAHRDSGGFLEPSLPGALLKSATRRLTPGNLPRLCPRDAESRAACLDRLLSRSLFVYYGIGA